LERLMRAEDPLWRASHDSPIESVSPRVRYNRYSEDTLPVMVATEQLIQQRMPLLQQALARYGFSCQREGG
jgi:hypothetical protein